MQPCTQEPPHRLWKALYTPCKSHARVLHQILPDLPQVVIEITIPVLPLGQAYFSSYFYFFLLLCADQCWNLPSSSTPSLQPPCSYPSPPAEITVRYLWRQSCRCQCSLLHRLVPPGRPLVAFLPLKQHLNLNSCDTSILTHYPHVFSDPLHSCSGRHCYHRCSALQQSFRTLP